MKYFIQHGHVMQCLAYDYILFLCFVDGLCLMLYVLCVNVSRIMKEKGFKMKRHALQIENAT
jgi:hypothetical protein